MGGRTVKLFSMAVRAVPAERFAIKELEKEGVSD